MQEAQVDKIIVHHKDGMSIERLHMWIVPQHWIKAHKREEMPIFKTIFVNIRKYSASPPSSFDLACSHMNKYSSQARSNEPRALSKHLQFSGPYNSFFYIYDRHS